MTRHFAALTVLVLFGICGVAIAAHNDDDVTQLTTTLPVMHPGQTGWVSTLWRAGPTSVDQFTLHTSPEAGITVSYPENTPGYSSLYKQSTLLASDTDYASFKVKVGDSVRGTQTIRLTVEYVPRPEPGKNKPTKPVTRHLEVRLPVEEATGPVVEQVTTTAGPVPAGGSQWLNVYYKANKPGVTGAKLRVTVPAGATVTYPNDGSWSGFNTDSDLAVHESDYASFKFHTGTLSPGSYQVGLDLSWGVGQDLPGSLTVTVG